MGVLSGLSKIRETLDERGSFENVSDRELTRNLESGKKGRKIRFLQELDEAAPGYNEALGTGLVAVERQHPSLYWLTLVERFDEDQADWPAEQDWEQKINLYVNVIDVDTDEIFYVARSALGGLGKAIIDSAESRGKLTDGVWTIKKTGAGMKTRYDLQPVEFGEDPVDVDPEDLIDFRKSVLNDVPYEEQERYVRQVEKRVAAKNGDAVLDTATESTDSDDDGELW